MDGGDQYLSERTGNHRACAEARTMMRGRLWLSGALFCALAACTKPAAEDASAAKQGNDPAETGAVEIEAKANAEVKAKIATIEAATEKQAAAVEAAAAEAGAPVASSTKDVSGENAPEKHTPEKNAPDKTAPDKK